MPKKLKELFGIIADEANTNPDFAAKLARVFGDGTTARARGRRSPAIIDPIALYQSETEQGLRVSTGAMAPHIITVIRRLGGSDAV